MREMGFRPLLPDALQAPIIVTFHTPADPRFDFKTLYDRLAQRGYLIYPGKLTKIDSFRIGCIGRLYEKDIRGALAAIREALAEMGARDGEPRGRLTLGIGLAHPETVAGWWGLSYDRPARYMREYLTVLLPLLGNKTVSFRGDVHRAAVSLEFPGVPAPSVLLAALAPAMLQMAGAITDGTITWMVGTAALTAHIVPHIRRAAEQAGRPTPRIAVSLPVAVTDDPQAARRTVAQRFKRYGELINYRRVLDIGGGAGAAGVGVI